MLPARRLNSAGADAPAADRHDVAGQRTRQVPTRDQSRPRPERGDRGPRVGLAVALRRLALVLLYRQGDSAKFERAARRWVRRVQINHSLRHEEVELLRAAMGALGSRFSRVALTVLLETCRELRLPAPTCPKGD